MTTIVREFITSENRYAIVYNEAEKWYGAINYKYIDENGRLTRQLNGLQMKIGDSVEKVINNVLFAEKFRALIAQGMSLEEASLAMLEA